MVNAKITNLLPYSVENYIYILLSKIRAILDITHNAMFKMLSSHIMAGILEHMAYGTHQNHELASIMSKITSIYSSTQSHAHVRIIWLSYLPKIRAYAVTLGYTILCRCLW